MKNETVVLPEIKLVGISVLTSYQNELDKMGGKIFPCVKEYFHGGVAERIRGRKRPGATFCVYAEYESDYKGAYRYFIGEEVEEFEGELDRLVIPAQEYVKFTNGPAAMPEVVVGAWREIWEMDLERNYVADFEIYDERAADHQKIVLDLYVGMKRKSDV